MLAVTAVCYELMSLAVWHFMPQLADQFMTLSIWGTVCNILCIQCGWCMDNVFINNPTWYICVLMLCYIIFWLITDRSRKKNISPVYGYLIMIALGFSLIKIKAEYPFFNENAARGYIAFFLGLLLAIAEDRYELHGGIGASCFLAAVGVLLALSGETNTICYLLFPLIILLFTSDRVEKIFSAKVWNILGAIQFHTFLWHLIIIECARIIMALSGADIKKRIYMFITAVIAELVGTLSYFLLDKPMDRLFMAVLPKKKAAVK